MIRQVVVLGGGSAGLLAALSLKIRLPQLKVRVVFSREIGIIGVGEGSTGVVPSPTGDGEILFKVAEVFEPAGADASTVPEEAQKSFASGFSDDLLDELVAQLQTQYDVRVDQVAVEQAQQ